MIIFGQIDSEVITLCGFSKKKEQYLYTGPYALRVCLLNLIKAVDEDVIFTPHEWILEMIYTELQQIKTITELRCDVSKNNKFRSINFKQKGKFVTIKTLQNYIPLDEEEILKRLGWSTSNTDQKNYSIGDEFNNNIQNIRKIIKDLDFCLSQITKYWWKKNNITNISWFFFRKCLDTVKTTIPLEAVDKLESARWGGRCYLNKPGLYANVAEVDFNSMYGSELLGEFPTRYTCLSTDSSLDACGFHYVNVTSNLEIPILPTIVNGKTEYINGSFKGLYWYEELLFFNKMGGVVHNIEYSILFEDSVNLFNQKAQECLDKRRLGTTIENVIYKSIINRFIGLLWYDKDRQNNQIYMIYPLIINSRARIRWYRRLLDIHSMGYKCIYGDTDSLFFEEGKVGELGAFFPDMKYRKFSLIFFFKKKKYIVYNKNNWTHVGLPTNVTFINLLSYNSLLNE